MFWKRVRSYCFLDIKAKGIGRVEAGSGGFLMEIVSRIIVQILFFGVVRVKLTMQMFYENYTCIYYVVLH